MKGGIRDFPRVGVREDSAIQKMAGDWRKRTGELTRDSIFMTSHHWGLFFMPKVLVSSPPD